MIHKNTKISKTENITLLEFGHGTITFVRAEHEETKTKQLLLKSQEDSQPIGSTRKITKGDSDQWKPEVILSFKNPESVEALIETLIEVHKSFSN